MQIVRTQVRIPKMLIDWLKQEAKQQGRSMNAQLIQLIESNKKLGSEK